MSEQIAPAYGTYPAPGEESGRGEYEAPMLIAMSIGEVTLGSFDREYPDVIGQYSWTKPPKPGVTGSGTGADIFF